MLSSAFRSLSVWSAVPAGPPDPILGVTEAFKADKDPRKINLGVGAYRDENGKPYVLPSVQKAEELFNASKPDKEYLPITGLGEFTQRAALLAYGAESVPLNQKAISITQSISGTGALRIGGAFLARHYPNSKAIYLPTPTWGNHIPLFQDSGLEVRGYRYFDKSTVGLDFEGLKADLLAAPEGAIVLLHACAHNPTGIDPTPEQWATISDIVKERKLFPFFDMAYQGFASGSTDRDAHAVRLFVKEGHQVAVAQSFAKNMGLYGERVGAFSLTTASSEEKARVDSQLKIIIRPMYSNPPSHGARIANTILGNEALYTQWTGEVKGMADRIISMREKLYNLLTHDLKTPGEWGHIKSQIGMFSFTGLTAPQTKVLAEKAHVYMTSNGRISMAGLNSTNVNYFAESVNAALLIRDHEMDAYTLPDPAEVSAPSNRLVCRLRLCILTPTMASSRSPSPLVPGAWPASPSPSRRRPPENSPGEPHYLRACQHPSDSHYRKFTPQRGIHSPRNSGPNPATSLTADNTPSSFASDDLSLHSSPANTSFSSAYTHTPLSKFSFSPKRFVKHKNETKADPIQRDASDIKRQSSETDQLDKPDTQEAWDQTYLSLPEIPDLSSLSSLRDELKISCDQFNISSNDPVSDLYLEESVLGPHIAGSSKRRSLDTLSSSSIQFRRTENIQADSLELDAEPLCFPQPDGRASWTLFLPPKSICSEEPSFSQARHSLTLATSESGCKTGTSSFAHVRRSWRVGSSLPPCFLPRQEETSTRCYANKVLDHAFNRRDGESSLALGLPGRKTPSVLGRSQSELPSGKHSAAPTHSQARFRLVFKTVKKRVHRMLARFSTKGADTTRQDLAPEVSRHKDA
ncbi:hypothetical protein D9756_003806 [Leucocoprinus leucothites]|uniref:Aspartate aminotransferase n=1 Tax=Leucocoprinus leucothites TaxID=201217 RepID=A0A8H5G0L8_9AGAR|nr:hypothetical protein D9756_003806 [Leucoagaricus leucothites]